MFKRTSRVIAIVLTFCMIFTMNSAVFAATATQTSDDTFTYVSLGAGETDGYGVASGTAYPDLLKTQIKKDTGKTVELNQLAQSSMRAEEVRVLLDETYDGDAYTAYYFGDSLKAQRADTIAAVKDADMITLQAGMNNFGMYALNQIVSGGTMFDSDISSIAAADKLQLFNTAKDMIVPMISDELGYSSTDNIDLIADTFAYAYVGYKTSFDAIIAKIREYNPDAQIVVLGIPNIMEGIVANVPGADEPMDMGELFGAVVDLGNLHASSNSEYNDEYYFAKVGDATTFLDEIAAYNGKPTSLSSNMKKLFDTYDENLKVTEKVTAQCSGVTSTKRINAIRNGYDVVATVMQAGANQNVIDMEVFMNGDFEAATETLYKYINDSINTGVTYAKKGKTYNFTFKKSLLDDPAVATVLAMGVRCSIGNGFFSMPNATGHQEIADSVLESIDFEITGDDAAAAEMSAAMNDLMTLLLEISPAMFDSQDQIVTKLKKAVNNLDQYAKAEQDNFADVRAEYKGKSKMTAVLDNVEDDMAALRKEIKTAKSAIGTLAAAADADDLAALETAAAAVSEKMDEVDAAAAALDESVKAAVKKARELKYKYDNLRNVAADMSSYVSLAYATTGIMKSDARQTSFAVEDDMFYTVLGDGSTQSKSASSTYARKLIADLGFTGTKYRDHLSNEGIKGMRVEDLLYLLDEEYIPDAYGQEEYGSDVDFARNDEDGVVSMIKKSDLITIGFSNNTMLDFAVDQLTTVMKGKPAYTIDWTRYLDEAAAAEITAVMEQIETTVAESLGGVSIAGFNMDNMGKAMRAAIEGYAYCYLSFFANYQDMVNKVAEINPDAEIILVGQFNPFDGTVLEMEGEELPMGEYMAYLTDLMNLQLRGYAMMTGKAIYVEAEDVTVSNADYAGNIDMMSFVSQLLLNGTSGLYADLDSHVYIKDQILGAIKLVDPETKAAMNKIAGLYDLLDVTNLKFTAADNQIKEASDAYDALTDVQKEQVDEELVQLLNFYKSDIDYVKALAIQKTNVTSLKTTLSTKTTLKTTWKSVTGAQKYAVKVYRNGKLLKSTTTTKTSYTMTSIVRGCTYKVSVQPVRVYNGVSFAGVAKAYSVTSKLDKVKPTVKKSGSKVTIKAADQNSYGFQVRISKDKKFKKSVKTYSYATSYKGLNKTLKLTTFKKGTNYVQVRAYTKYNGKISYGAWSSTKTVKR